MWTIILDKMGLDSSHLECIKGYDLLSPNYIGDHEAHATNTTESEIIKAYELFSELDKLLMNNKYLSAAQTWNCVPMQMTTEPEIFTLDEDPVEKVRLADIYA